MVKKAFCENLRLNGANQERLVQINKILEDYQEQGYTLTLRQLYYQLVSRGIIPNQQKEYAKLSGLIVKGRMAGVIDWGAIEDRLRVPFLPYWNVDINDALQDSAKQYRVNRMRNQDTYIELWVEKDALSGVLKNITSKYHINLMVNRGYSSCSAMHDAFIRLNGRSESRKIILYLGDHDPSGLDMIRDINDRLIGFGLENFEVRQIGLTWEQIQQYAPPPNPAKVTDPRAKKYIAEFGRVSWEVDALNPKTLHQLVSNNVEDLINPEIFSKQMEREDLEKTKLQQIADKYKAENIEDDNFID